MSDLRRCWLSGQKCIRQNWMCHIEYYTTIKITQNLLGGLTWGWYLMVDFFSPWRDTTVSQPLKAGRKISNLICLIRKHDSWSVVHLALLNPKLSFVNPSLATNLYHLLSETLTLLCKWKSVLKVMLGRVAGWGNHQRIVKMYDPSFVVGNQFVYKRKETHHFPCIPPA